MKIRARGGGGNPSRYPVTPGKSCFSGVYLKRRYASAQAAEQSLQTGERLYECPDCGGWHKSTKEKK